MGLLVLLFGLGGLVNSQSCIVYKKEPNGIFIGVDTRSVNFVVNENTKRTEMNFLNMCKTDRVKNISFAVTGYATDLAIKEAITTLQNVPSFQDAIIQYTYSIAKKLADMLETDRHIKPTAYKKKYPAGTILGGAVFVYYENGMLFGRVVTLTLESLPTERSLVGTTNKLIDSIGVTGSSIATRNILMNKDIWKKGTVAGINKIISLEKLANPTQLEGLADIFFVSDKNEYEWVQRNQCQ